MIYETDLPTQNHNLAYNGHSRLPISRSLLLNFDVPSPGNSHEYRHKSWSLCYIFVVDNISLSYIQSHTAVSEKCMNNVIMCTMVIQGHPRSQDFDTNQNRVYDFLLVINRTSIIRFRDKAT